MTTRKPLTDELLALAALPIAGKAARNAIAAGALALPLPTTTKPLRSHANPTPAHSRPHTDSPIDPSQTPNRLQPEEGPA